MSSEKVRKLIHCHCNDRLMADMTPYEGIYTEFAASVLSEAEKEMEDGQSEDDAELPGIEDEPEEYDGAESEDVGNTQGSSFSTSNPALSGSITVRRTKSN